jgi:hypothetical protein
MEGRKRRHSNYRGKKERRIRRTTVLRARRRRKIRVREDYGKPLCEKVGDRENEKWDKEGDAVRRGIIHEVGEKIHTMEK